MSKAKYSVHRSATWKWVHEQGNPMFTDHALDRYVERTPHDVVSPERAWENSVNIEVIKPWFQKQSPIKTKMVRFYAGISETGRWGAAFPVADNGDGIDTIPTVYSIESIRDAPIRAFLHAVADSIIAGRSDQ